MAVRRIFLGCFVLVAVALHWCLSFVEVPFRTFEALQRDNLSEPIVIEPLDNTKQIVSTSQAINQDDSSKKDARFHGELRNRVKKQLKSPFVGRFKQRKRGGGHPKGDGPELSDLMGRSASPDHLPDDIAEGSETILDTDPVRYASFINRIADEIYDSWVYFANQAVAAIYLRGRKLQVQTYVTKLTLVMDREGKLASIKTLKSSGIRELDEAPKKAFWESEPFPNPPSQMFGKQELVKFVYEFHFEWRSAAFNIIPLI